MTPADPGRTAAPGPVCAPVPALTWSDRSRSTRFARLCRRVRPALFGDRATRPGGDRQPLRRKDTRSRRRGTSGSGADRP